ncbi:hypothetical protein [Streptomyces umbrinus]|uniref:hypothetical protein n=1 Tax=Streptomyces umbrinus TaxID=67370 RepID=UPI0033FEEAD9
MGLFAVPAEEVGELLESVVARWTLTAALLERAAGSPELLTALLGPFAAPAGDVGELLEPLVARCTLAVVLPVALPELVAVSPELGTAPLGSVAVPAAEVGVLLGAGDRWMPVAASPGRDAALLGPGAAPRGPFAVRLGPAAGRLRLSPVPLEPVGVVAGRVGMLLWSAAAL